MKMQKNCDLQRRKTPQFIPPKLWLHFKSSSTNSYTNITMNDTNFTISVKNLNLRTTETQIKHQITLPCWISQMQLAASFL